MRTAVSLYEFMPYGAPDLIESRRRHLSYALLLASGVALALYALTIGLSAFVPVTPAEQVTTFTWEPQPWTPAIESRPAPPRTPAVRPKPAASAYAPPVPVPDALAPTDVKAGDVTESPAADAPIGTATAGDANAQVQTGDALPARGQWVYVEELPDAIKQVTPEYPDWAQKAGVEGPVNVFVLVGTEGRVLRVELDEKVQSPMLNEAALAAARQWVFSPGLANGKPVACWTLIPFRFRLN